MGLVGDFSKLRELQRVIKTLDVRTRSKFRTTLAQRLSATAVKLVADEFRGSKDPYGKPWAPVVRNDARTRKAKRRRAKAGKPIRADKPLVNTGRMKNSVNGQPYGVGFRISIPVVYAKTHQYGRGAIKQRQMLPEDNTGGLGPKWKVAFARETAKVAREMFEGVR